MFTAKNQPNHRRGRPPRIRSRKTAYTLSEYCEHTGQSRSTVLRQMARGQLRYAQAAPGTPRRIPVSEFLRLGFDRPSDEAAE